MGNYSTTLMVLAWAALLIIGWRFAQYLYAHWRVRQINRSVRAVARECGLSDDEIDRIESGRE